MKKILSLLTIVMMVTQTISAQVSISTNKRDEFNWNEEDKKWELQYTDATSNTLFEFNKEVTQFTHTTASISSTYYIKSKEANEENTVFTYDIISDVGNKYRMIIDLVNNNVRFIATKKGGTYRMVRHTIKSYWTGDKSGE